MQIRQFPLYKDDPMVTLTAYILDDSPEMLNGAIPDAGNISRL